MKNRFLYFLLLLLFPLSLAAQQYTGIVVDVNKVPLKGVSVVLLGGENKKVVLSFTKTNDKGAFSMPVHAKGSSLMFNLLGYERKTLPAQQFKKQQTVTLNEKDFKIKQVVIKAPTINIKGDTLTYSVNAFKQEQDKTISDIIKRLPGLSVDKDGAISYQGRRINKFYIEGMDLLGSKYNQASENLSADKVKSVQVYENHQPIKLHRNRSFSQQAALNIVLKEDAKNVWQGLLDVGFGTTLQDKVKLLSDNRFMEMFFAKRMQSISMYKMNNMGENIKKEIDIARLFGFQAPIENRLTTNYSTSVPDLNDERTKFNQTHIIASNWLFKTKKKNDLRIQLSGMYDKNTYNDYNQTDYIDILNNKRIVNTYDAIVRRRKAEGEMMYKVNKDNTYFTNTLRGGIDLTKSLGAAVLNGKPTYLYSKPHKTYFADDLEVIKRLKNGRDLSLRTYFSYTNLPERLLLIDSTFQQLNTHAMYWGVTSYYGHNLGRLNLRYNLSNKGGQQRMQIQTQGKEQTINYTHNKLSFTPSLSHIARIYTWDISFPLSLLTQNKKGVAHKQQLLFEPNCSFTYKPTARWTINTSYTFSKNTLDAIYNYNLPVYTSYKFQIKGNDQFSLQQRHNVNSRITYRNISLGIFSALNSYYSYSPKDYLYLYGLNGDILLYQLSQTTAKNQNFSVSWDITKSFGSRLTFSVGTYINRLYYHYLKDESTKKGKMQNLNFSFNFNYRPTRWFSIDEKSYLFLVKQWATSDNKETHRTRIFNHELSLHFSYKKLVLTSKNELYHSRDNSTSFNFFSNLQLSLKHRKNEFSLLLNNLLGTKEYKRQSILRNSTVWSINKIRPREILFKYSFNF